MRNNLIHIPNSKKVDYSDEVHLTQEIRELIRKYQNENLPYKTRERAFYKIIDLTEKLTD